MSPPGDLRSLIRPGQARAWLKNLMVPEVTLAACRREPQMRAIGELGCHILGPCSTSACCIRLITSNPLRGGCTESGFLDQLGSGLARR